MIKALAVIGTALILGGCIVATPPPPRRAVIVTPPPPAPAAPAEVVPPAPGPGVVWVPGHYAWNGAAYVWRPVPATCGSLVTGRPSPAAMRG